MEAKMKGDYIGRQRERKRGERERKEIYLLQCSAVGAVFSEVAASRVVPHEMLSQEVDGVEVISHPLALLQPSLAHLCRLKCNTWTKSKGRGHNRQKKFGGNPVIFLSCS